MPLSSDVPILGIAGLKVTYKDCSTNSAYIFILLQSPYVLVIQIFRRFVESVLVVLKTLRSFTGVIFLQMFM